MLFNVILSAIFVSSQKISNGLNVNVETFIILFLSVAIQ